MIQLLDYDFQIIYRPGSKNQDADALSRQSWDSATSSEEELAGSQPRTDGVSVGRAVGISPHIERKKEEEAETGCLL